MYTSGILPHVDETERVSNNPKREAARKDNNSNVF